MPILSAPLETELTHIIPAKNTATMIALFVDLFGRSISRQLFLMVCVAYGKNRVSTRCTNPTRSPEPTYIVTSPIRQVSTLVAKIITQFYITMRIWLLHSGP